MPSGRPRPAPRGSRCLDLVRRAIDRVHAWTVAHAEVERERTREVARIGANLNQIARWANTFKANAEALEVIAHLVAIERALDTLAVEVEGGPRAMMVKFLAHGTQSAAVAAAYLLREGHHEKDPDPDQAPEEITVLRGNPGQVTAVADALAFEHRYTSGLFAWAPEDAPSDRQISRVLDEFEKTAWAGLEPDRYTWAAVQHRNADGGVHVHILAARCDLATGKSLNIAPPGWEKTFGALRDWQNHEHGWSRPDDPERARDLQPGHTAYIEAAQLRAGLTTEPDPRRLITDYVRQGIEAGVIEDRATMVAALQRADLEVPRQGKDYLTVADPASGGRWRLKGAIYDREFSRERPGSPAQEAGRGGGADARAGDQERAQAALRQLLELRRSRGAYHRKTYGVGAVQGVGAPGRDRPVDLSRHLRRELGPDALPSRSGSRPSSGRGTR